MRRAERCADHGRQRGRGQMGRARKVRWFAVAALLLSLHALTACGSPGRNEMTSEEARGQLSTAVDVVKTAAGQGWVVDIEPTLLGCSRTHSQWTTSWSGSPTTGRDSSYASVREALEEAGFATYINGDDTTTPVLSAGLPMDSALIFRNRSRVGPSDST